jgi:hypothetical protein
LAWLITAVKATKKKKNCNDHLRLQEQQKKQFYVDPILLSKLFLFDTFIDTLIKKYLKEKFQSFAQKKIE